MRVTSREKRLATRPLSKPDRVDRRKPSAKITLPAIHLSLPKGERREEVVGER